MTKQERLWARIEAMEAQYQAALIEALRACAQGAWGLFGQNEHIGGGRPDVVEELLSLGDAIDRMRSQADGLPYDLHQRFVAARGRHGENDVGEPKKARLWLAELAPD